MQDLLCNAYVWCWRRNGHTQQNFQLVLIRVPLVLACVRWGCCSPTASATSSSVRPSCKGRRRGKGKTRGLVHAAPCRSSLAVWPAGGHGPTGLSNRTFPRCDIWLHTLRSMSATLTGDTSARKNLTATSCPRHTAAGHVAMDGVGVCGNIDALGRTSIAT